MRSDFSILCRELLREDVHVRMHVSGSSMRPTLQEGDVVELRPATSQHLRRGDLVLFESGRGLTLHRVIRNSGTVLITRGDASAADDHPVPPEEVLGIAVSRTREGRRVELHRPRLLVSFLVTRLRVLALPLLRRLRNSELVRLRRSPAS